MTNSETQHICWKSGKERVGNKYLKSSHYSSISEINLSDGQSTLEESLAALDLAAANIFYPK